MCALFGSGMNLKLPWARLRSAPIIVTIARHQSAIIAATTVPYVPVVGGSTQVIVRNPTPLKLGILHAMGLPKHAVST